MVDNIVKNKKMFIRRLEFHMKPVNRVHFNESGTLFATCGDDAIINIHNALTFQHINRFELQNSAKYFCFTKKDDKIIVIGGLGDLYIFDIYKFQEDQEGLVNKPADSRVNDIDLSYGDNYLGVIYKKFDRSQTLKIFERKDLEINKMNTMLDAKYRISPSESDFVCFRFYIKENIFFIGRRDNIVAKYDLEKSVDEPQSEICPYLEDIYSLTFSPKFEFLLVNCKSGVGLIDPETMNVFKVIKTPYPVRSSQVSPLMYHPKNPKFHIILAGGIPAREQAKKSEGGNEIYIFNISNGKKLA